MALAHVACATGMLALALRASLVHLPAGLHTHVSKKVMQHMQVAGCCGCLLLSPTLALTSGPAQLPYCSAASPTGCAGLLLLPCTASWLGGVALSLLSSL